MSSFREHNATLICEGTPALIGFQLTNERDVELLKSQLETITLSLYVSSKGAHFGEVINSRDEQDVLDTNGGTLYDGATVAPDGTTPASGWLELRLSAADNELLSQSRGFETHVALFKWTWVGGDGDPGVKELSFVVANQLKMGLTS